MCRVKIIQFKFGYEEIGFYLGLFYKIIDLGCCRLTRCDN